MNYHEEKIKYHQEKIKYHKNKMENTQQDNYKCYVAFKIAELLTEMHGNDPCWLSEKLNRIKEFENNCLVWDFIANGLDPQHKEKYAEMHGISLEELKQFFKILNKLT